MNEVDFAYSRHCLDRIFKKTGSPQAAAALLHDALSRGFVIAIGFPVPNHGWQLITLPKLVDPSQLARIPQRFWQTASKQDIGTWSWAEGSFSVSDPQLPLSGAAGAYTDVRFESRGVTMVLRGRVTPLASKDLDQEAIVVKPTKKQRYKHDYPTELASLYHFANAGTLEAQYGKLATLGTLAKLEATITSMMKNPPSERTIRRQAEKLFQINAEAKRSD